MEQPNAQQVAYHLVKDFERLEKAVSEMQKHITQIRIDMEKMKAVSGFPINAMEIMEQQSKQQVIPREVIVGSGSAIGAVGLFEFIKYLIEVFRGS